MKSVRTPLALFTCNMNPFSCLLYVKFTWIVLVTIRTMIVIFYSKFIVQCHVFPLYAGLDGSFSWRQNHIWHIWIWTAALMILTFDSFWYSCAFIIFKFTFYFDYHLNWLHSQLLHSNFFILYENPQNGVYFVPFLRHVKWENVWKFAVLSSGSTSTSLFKKSNLSMYLLIRLSSSYETSYVVIISFLYIKWTSLFSFLLSWRSWKILHPHGI